MFNEYTHLTVYRLEQAERERALARQMMIGEPERPRRRLHVSFGALLRLFQVKAPAIQATRMAAPAPRPCREAMPSHSPLL